MAIIGVAGVATVFNGIVTGATSTTGVAMTMTSAGVASGVPTYTGVMAGKAVAGVTTEPTGVATGPVGVTIAIAYWAIARIGSTIAIAAYCTGIGITADGAARPPKTGEAEVAAAIEAS